MKTLIAVLATSAALLLSGCSFFTDSLSNDDRDGSYGKNESHNIQLGPRPFYLVDDMGESRLKRKLESCKTGPFYRTDFSIGHRGAPICTQGMEHF